MKRKQQTKKEEEDKSTKKRKVEDEPEEDEGSSLPPLQTVTVELNTKEKTNLKFYITNDTVAKPTDETIQTAEKMFFKGVANISFPEEYKYFLKTYNGGTVVSGDLKSEREDLIISYFLPLLDPKKGREENIEDSDDDDDDEDGGIAEYLELGENTLPKNYMPIAIDVEGAVFLMNVDSTSGLYGNICYWEEVDDEEVNAEDEQDAGQKLKGGKGKKKQREEEEKKKKEGEGKVKGNMVVMADSFNQFLKNIMSDEEKEERRKVRIEKRLKQIESAKVLGAMRQFVDKWKGKYSHIEDHCRALVRRWEEVGVDHVDNAASLPEDSENVPLFRLVTLAMFFIEKEKTMESNTQKKKQQKRQKKKKKVLPKRISNSNKNQMKIKMKKLRQ